MECYIRYHETEKLFSLWPLLESINEGLLADLNYLRGKRAIGTDDDYIYSMCIGNKVLNDMPPSGVISDTTGNIAANYSKAMRYDRKDTRNEIKDEAFEILLVIAKLEIAFRRLNSLQKRILELYYWEEKPWKEIMECMCVSKRRAKEEKTRGIERMTRVSGITIESYENIVKIVNEKFVNKL